MLLSLGCYLAVGLENGQIRDSQLSASSSKSYYEPHQARLHLTAGPKGNGAWCAAKSAIAEYLQVNFFIFSVLKAKLATFVAN